MFRGRVDFKLLEYGWSKYTLLSNIYFLLAAKITRNTVLQSRPKIFGAGFMTHVTCRLTAKNRD